MAIRTLCSDSVRLAIHFFVNFVIFRWCILLTIQIGSIYTKLEDFVKLGVHFMTTSIWITSCLSHNLQTLT